MGLLIGPALVRLFQRCIGATVNNLHQASLTEVVAGAIGLCVGLLIAILITIPIPRSIPVIGDYIPLLITAFLGYISTIVSVRKRMTSSIADGNNAAKYRAGSEKRRKTSPGGDRSLTPVSLSTVGYRTFVYRIHWGTLYVPGFVLGLQHIADSSDVLKRNRGRRGLDILNKMQKERKVNVKVLEWDYDDISEVDTKLVKLAKAECEGYHQ